MKDSMPTGAATDTKNNMIERALMRADVNKEFHIVDVRRQI